MKRNSLSKGERRFLILWLSTWSFAFFVNFTDINGKIGSSAPHYIFTINKENREKDFYPFTEFIGDEKKAKRSWSNPYVPDWYTCFYGFFPSFNFIEWITFCALGIGIVFVPKIW